MADDTTQLAAHRFFIEHLQTLEPFTKEDVRAATGWSEATADAYWSKQFKNILEQVDDTRYYRVRDRFRLFTDWKKFKNLVTHVPGELLNSRVFLGSRDLARIVGARSGRPYSASAGDRRPTRRPWRRPFRGSRIRARQAPTADPQSLPEAFTQTPLL